MPACILGMLGVGASGALASTVPPTTYYVDCSSSTLPAIADGSSASPWRSLDEVNAHLPFLPGDKILVKRGTACSGRLHPTGSGAAGEPITIGAYGSGAKPTINGKGTPNGTATVELTNQHDWTVQDLRVTNAGKSKSTKTYRSGVMLVNYSGGHLGGMTLQRLTVTSVWSNPAHGPSRSYGGISVLTSGIKGDGFTDLQVLHNSVSQVGRTGIAVFNNEYPGGSDAKPRVGYNSVSWVRGDSIIMVGAKNGRIDHNVSAHGAALFPCPQCGKITPDTADAGMWTARSNTVLIDHNEVSGEHMKGGDGEALDIDQSAKNVTIEDNYAHDNEGGGVLVCGATNATIRYNILQNNARAFTFTCHPHSSDVKIYNNTVYMSKKVGTDVVWLRPGYTVTKLQFFNNIIYSYGPSNYRMPAHSRIVANTFIGTHAASEPRGSRTSRSDPRLRKPGSGHAGFGSLKGYRPVNAKHVQRGAAVPKSVTTDFFGVKVNPKSPHRGA